MRFFFLLWLALLVFSLPEVFAGSGQGWLTRPDVYILALPLYALHLFLICHIAIKTQRTSWPALYLWGVLFGLYETWITKVVWNGYPGSEGFATGSFGNWFGVHETLGLVLFYHPVTSFLLPLAVVSRLFPAFGKPFPVPDWVFGTTRWALARRVVLMLVWGVISGHNMPNIGLYLFSWLPMLLLLWLGYRFLEPRVTAKAASPVLGRVGLWGFSIWLLFIYGVSYFALLPESLPPAHIQVITLGLYLGAILLLWRLPPRETGLAPVAEPTSPAKMPLFWLMAVFATGLITSAAMTAAPEVATIAGLGSFLMMVLLGVGLFVWLGVWKVLARTRVKI